MNKEQVKELIKSNAELSVWGLKQTLLSKYKEVVDLELQVQKAEDNLIRLK